jgi:hypothetical protein
MQRIIKMWDCLWGNYMMKVKADKFWHFIGFLFFTIALNVAQIWNWVILTVVIILAIGKELWDWNHGRYFDFADLMADAVRIFLAYVINGVYIQVLT